MSLFNRKTLKNYFKKGSFPSEVHFNYLIDSTVNKIDDGYAKTPEDGLQLSPQGESTQLISFFDNLAAPSPRFQFNLLKNENADGLSLDRLYTNDEGVTLPENALFVNAKTGNVGIHTQSPATSLEVSGTAALETRIGALKIGRVPGDGKWHPLFEKELTGMHIFEVTARIKGPKGRGKYGFTHAVAIGVNRHRGSKVQQTCAYFGSFLNKIRIRWKGGWVPNEKGELEYKYNLYARTLWPYRAVTANKEETEYHYIYYHVAGLWDDDFFDAYENALSSRSEQPAAQPAK
ncbi:MAG: hypothetical protein H6562_04730 [Lewinellaceae bacterium]|nr:hypothetical protein [Lewinella sp.]MCB9278194.1 hypothetical protein [Lewinellaceae bacterium]